MEAFFSKEYYLVWAIILALMLFYPVRQLIWVMYVRRANKQGEGRISEAEQFQLKKRASFTSIILCFLFSIVYTGSLFN